MVSFKYFKVFYLKFSEVILNTFVLQKENPTVYMLLQKEALKFHVENFMTKI